MTAFDGLQPPITLWGLLDTARYRAPSNNDNPDGPRAVLQRMLYATSEQERSTEQVLRIVLDILVADMQARWTDMVGALRQEMSVIATMQSVIESLARMLPKLIEDPNAQVVADAVMEKRFDEARRVILELEREHGGLDPTTTDLELEQMQEIVKRMQTAAKPQT